MSFQDRNVVHLISKSFLVLYFYHIERLQVAKYCFLVPLRTKEADTTALVQYRHFEKRWAVANNTKFKIRFLNEGDLMVSETELKITMRVW